MMRNIVASWSVGFGRSGNAALALLVRTTFSHVLGVFANVVVDGAALGDAFFFFARHAVGAGVPLGFSPFCSLRRVARSFTIRRHGRLLDRVPLGYPTSWRAKRA